MQRMAAPASFHRALDAAVTTTAERPSEGKAASMATLRVEIGPCDDDAYFFMDGAPTVSVRIDQTRTVQRVLEDGAYDFRFMVLNSGGWAWKAKARILVDGQEIYSVDRTGGTGFWTGPVVDESRQFTIRNGRLAEF
jgi:hypothetical protein